jgi:glycosyltransferase involved in cell wall biosynthesis
MPNEKLPHSYDLVSVIIPTHNYGRYISEAIESVLAQSYPNVEIIVVDDGSTDDTEAVVKKYPMVKYVYQEHIGQPTPARAKNNGIRLSKGKYIVCLDADDQFLPSYITECMAVTKTDPKIGMVWTASLLFGTDPKRLVSKFYLPQVKNPHTRYSFYATPGGTIGAALIPRKVYDDVGLYDESLVSIEDLDFVIRLLQHHWKAKSIYKPLHKYRMHDQNIHEGIMKLGLKQLYKRYPMMYPYRTVYYFGLRIYRFFMHPNYTAHKVHGKLHKILNSQASKPTANTKMTDAR